MWFSKLKRLYCMLTGPVADMPLSVSSLTRRSILIETIFLRVHWNIIKCYINNFLLKKITVGSLFYYYYLFVSRSKSGINHSKVYGYTKPIRVQLRVMRPRRNRGLLIIMALIIFVQPRTVTENIPHVTLCSHSSSVGSTGASPPGVWV